MFTQTSHVAQWPIFPDEYAADGFVIQINGAHQAIKLQEPDRKGMSNKERAFLGLMPRPTASFS